MSGYLAGDLKHWKDDKFLKEIILTSLSDEVVQFLYKDVKFQSFALLVRLLEHEIIAEIGKTYTGEIDTEVNLRIAKQIQNTLEPKK
jgi:hypothetical protein